MREGSDCSRQDRGGGGDSANPCRKRTTRTARMATLPRSPTLHHYSTLVSDERQRGQSVSRVHEASKHRPPPRRAGASFCRVLRSTVHQSEVPRPAIRRPGPILSAARKTSHMAEMSRWHSGILKRRIPPKSLVRFKSSAVRANDRLPTFR